MSLHDQPFSPDAVTLDQCAYCQHQRGRSAIVCRAFPGGVPDVILGNQFDHRQPHPDENEPVHFEPREDADPGALARLYAVLDSLA